MANARRVELELVGKNTSAIRAINETAAAAEVAAGKASSTFEKGTTKIGGLLGKLEQQAAGFGIPFAGALSSVGNKFEEAEGKGKGLTNTLASIGAVEAVAAAAGLAAVGIEAVHAADAFEESHARLEQAVKNAGLSFEDESSKISATDSKLEKFGFTNTETENAMSRLVTATRSVGKAQADVAIAADISRARNIDLTSATDILVKVEAGRYTQLTRLGLATKEQVAGFHNSAEAVQFLADKFKGQASAYADTFSGKLQVLRATGEDLAVTIGQAIVPQIEHLASGAVSLVSGFESANEATGGLLGKIALGAAALPLATFAINGVVSAGGRLKESFTKAAESLGISTAATEADAAAQTGYIGIIEARVAAEAQLEAAVGAQIAANETVNTAILAQIDAEAALTAAQTGLSTGAVSLADAQGAVTAANDAVAVSTIAVAEAEAGATGAAEALAAAQAQVAETRTAEALTQIGASGEAAGVGISAAIGPIGLVAGVAAVAGAALYQAFGQHLDDERSRIQGLGEDLLATSGKANEAAATLARIISPTASAQLKEYANALLAGANAEELAARKGELTSSSAQEVATKLFGAQQAAYLLRNGVDAAIASNEQFASAMGEVQGKVDLTTGAMDRLKAKYGEAGVQTLELQNAQKRYSDLLASGSASVEQLARAHDDVVAAAKANATTQDAVTAATKQGADAAKGATDANNAEAASLQHLNDVQNAAIGGTLGLERANHQAKAAVDDYNKAALEAIATKGKDAEKNKVLQDATDQVKESIFQASQAAAANAKANVDLTSKLTGTALADKEAKAAHDAQTAALLFMKAKYPELSPVIQSYIDTLNAIPTTKTTTVSVVFAPGAAAGGGGTRRFASGGTAEPGEVFSTGEEGPELAQALPGGGVRVLSNPQSRHFLAQMATPRAIASGHMAGGVVNIRIESHVDPITGRSVHKLVQDDQAMHGPWRIKIAS